MIDLVMNVKGLGVFPAIEWLEKAYGLGAQRGPEALRLRIETARKGVRRDQSLPPELVTEFLKRFAADLRWYNLVPVEAVRDHLAEIIDYVYSVVDVTVEKVERGEAGAAVLEEVARWGKALCWTRFRSIIEVVTETKKGDRDGRAGKGKRKRKKAGAEAQG